MRTPPVFGSASCGRALCAHGRRSSRSWVFGAGHTSFSKLESAGCQVGGGGSAGRQVFAHKAPTGSTDALAPPCCNLQGTLHLDARRKGHSLPGQKSPGRRGVCLAALKIVFGESNAPQIFHDFAHAINKAGRRREDEGGK